VRTLSEQGGVLALLAAFALLAHALRGEPDAARRRALRVAASASAAFAAFFILNNSRNGFVFASLLSAPLIVCLAASRMSGWKRWAPIALASALTFAGLREPASDPLLSESRFLTSALGRDGVLLVPGCPFPELTYFDPIHVLSLAASSCDAPLEDLKSLPERLAFYRLRGRTVLLALGSGDAEAEKDPFGALKHRQCFRPDGRNADRLEAQAAAALGAGAEPLRSPQGWRYLRLGAPSSAAADRIGASPSFEDRLRRLRPFSPDPVRRRRAEALADWLRRTPDDPFADRALSRELDGWARAAASEPGAAAPHYDAAIRAHSEKRTDEALREFSLALELEPGFGRGYLSRGAVWAETGQWRKALEDYDRAAWTNPDDPDFRNDLLTARATALARLGCLRSARKELEAAVRTGGAEKRRGAAGLLSTIPGGQDRPSCGAGGS
jgi:tetratricopeptide (TPR) repeat protein